MKRLPLHPFFGTVLAASLCACGPSAPPANNAQAAPPQGAPGQADLPPSITLPPELDRVLRDYERAWGASDEGALVDLFTGDGFVLSQGKPPVRGRNAIRQAYETSGGALALRAFAYATADSVGYIIGGFGTPGGGDGGKFVLALRRGADGRWLIAADIDNSNRMR
jgi:ketosteroid isomerase-like protein